MKLVDGLEDKMLEGQKQGEEEGCDLLGMEQRYTVLQEELVMQDYRKRGEIFLDNNILLW